MEKEKNRKKALKKFLLTLGTLVIAVGCGIGGTLAWLSDSTKTVTNTFTVGDIDIELTETGASGDGEVLENNSYKILPGTTQSKDPKVSVKEGSESCWLFVEITEKNNYVKNGESFTDKKFIEWAGNLADDGWTLLSPKKTPTPGETITYVYYIYKPTVGNYYVLKDFDGDKSNPTGEVSYRSDLEKADLEQAKALKPELMFKAYAIQTEGLKSEGTNISDDNADNAKLAWELVKKY